MRMLILNILFFAFILLFTSCQSESIIKIGMDEQDVVRVLKANDCEKVYQQSMRLKTVGDHAVWIPDDYYQLPNGKYIYIAFDEESKILNQITYLGEYQKDMSPKFVLSFDPAESKDYKEVDLDSFSD